MHLVQLGFMSAYGDQNLPTNHKIPEPGKHSQAGGTACTFGLVVRGEGDLLGKAQVSSLKS